MATNLAELERRRQEYQAEQKRQKAVGAVPKTNGVTYMAELERRKQEYQAAQKQQNTMPQQTNAQPVQTAAKTDKPSALQQFAKRQAGLEADMGSPSAVPETAEDRIAAQLAAARGQYAPAVAGLVQQGIKKAAEVGREKAMKNYAATHDLAAEKAYQQQVDEAVRAAMPQKLNPSMQVWADSAAAYRKYVNAATEEEAQAALAEIKALNAKKDRLGRAMEVASGAVGGGIVQLEAGVAKALDPLDKGGEADRVLQNVQDINTMNKASMGKLGRVFYDLGQTLANNGAAILATGGVGGTLALMGTSVGGQGIYDAQAAGANDKQALAAGVANGILEAAFEKVPLDRLFELAGGKMAGATMQKRLTDYAGDVLKQAGLEGASEAMTTIAQNLASLAIYEKETNPDLNLNEWVKETGKEALYSGLLGAVSGGVMAAPAAAIGARASARERAEAETVIGGHTAAATREEQAQENAAPLADSEAVQVGKATKIYKPYQGVTPINIKMQGEAERANINSEALEAAESEIIKAQNSGRFAKSIKDFFVDIFNKQGGQRSVTIQKVQFEGQPYEIMLNNSLAGKVASDPNMSKEKLAVFNHLDDIVAGAEFVGSGEYNKKGNNGQNSQKSVRVIRYDYFENEVDISGEPYVVAFDAEVYKDRNNLRTYKVINEVSLNPLTATPGPQPGAANGQDPLANSIIQSGEEYVKGVEVSAPPAADTENRAAEIDRAREICERLGVELRLEAMPEGMQGNYNNGVITMNPNAEDPVRQVFMHELTHYIERSGKYEAYARFAMEDMRGELLVKGQSIAAYADRLKAVYAEAGITLDDDGARREMVAIHTEQLFDNDMMIERLARTERGLFERIKQWLADMCIRFRGSREEKRLLAAWQKYEKALRTVDNEAARNEDGAVQYRIAKDIDGHKFVAVDEDILQGKSDEDIPRVLADIVQNKFHNLIEANGQIIGVDKTTRKEWQWSKSAASLYNNNKQDFNNKIRAFNNVDELLQASQEYINEDLKHKRNDKFSSFGRGKVQFKVGHNGYEADIVVGLYPDGNAVLYDIVNIAHKNIAETSQTDTPQKNEALDRGEVSATDIISNSELKDNSQGQFSLKRPGDFDERVKRQAEADEEFRQMVYDEIAADITDEAMKQEIFAGHGPEFNKWELENEILDTFHIAQGKIGAARAAVRDYLSRVQENVNFNWSTEQLANTLAAMIADKNSDIGRATERLNNRLYEMGGRLRSDYADANPGLREAMDEYKIFVPPDVRENIGGFKAIKESSKLGLRVRPNKNNDFVPYDKNWLSVDEAYDELQGLYGLAVFPELDNQTAKLQQMIAVRERLEPEFVSLENADLEFDSDSHKFLKGELEQSVKKYFEARKRRNSLPEAKQHELETEEIRQLLAISEDGINLEDVNPEDYEWAQSLKSIRMGYTLSSKDMSRVLDTVCGQHTPLRQKARREIEAPFFRAKQQRAKEMETQLNDLLEVMKACGIKKGSKESAAVQWIGEGFRPARKGDIFDFTPHDYDDMMARLEENSVLSDKQVSRLKKNMEQWLKDDKRPYLGNEVVKYSLDDLKAEFPDNWQNIVKMKDYVRGVYDSLGTRINETLKQIYPNIEERQKQYLEQKAIYVQRCIAQAQELAVAVQTINEQMEKEQLKLERHMAAGDSLAAGRSKALIRKHKDAIESCQSRGARLLERAHKADELIRQVQEDGLYDENAKRRRELFQRKNYFHHFTDRGTLESIRSFAKDLSNEQSKQEKISSALAGISADTKPKTQFWGAMQERQGAAYTADAIGGLLEYLPGAYQKIYIDPYIAKGRKIAAGIAQATEKDKNANTFLWWYNNWLNDLAGKTQEIDRGLKEQSGRLLWRGIMRTIGRVRMNSVVGNVGTAFAQFGNLQMASLEIGNPEVWAAAAKDFVQYTVNQNSGAHELQDMSGFLSERYIDKLEGKFDESIFHAPQKFANFMLRFGDEQVARLIWFAAARQFKAKKMRGDMVAYADDFTRRCVAGRGIGEMALLQKSDLVKAIAPFQVEVNNQWQYMKQMLSKDSGYTKAQRLAGFLRMFVVSHAMNAVFMGILGRTIVFDLIGALKDAFDDLDDEDEMSVWDRAAVMGKRLAGEIISAHGFGSPLAAALIPDEQDRAAIFGESDPTRYGTANIASEKIGGFIGDVLRGEDFSASGFELATSLLMKGYGGQLNKTIGAAQDMGLLPTFDWKLSDGLLPKINAPQKGSYTQSGRFRFDIDTGDYLNVFKGLMFGRWATDEGKAYIEGGAKSASDSATAKAQAFVEQYGGSVGEYIDIYNAVKDMHAGDKTSKKKKAEIDRRTPSLSRAAREQLYEDMGVSKKVW